MSTEAHVHISLSGWYNIYFAWKQFKLLHSTIFSHVNTVFRIFTQILSTLFCHHCSEVKLLSFISLTPSPSCALKIYILFYVPQLPHALWVFDHLKFWWGGQETCFLLKKKNTAVERRKSTSPSIWHFLTKDLCGHGTQPFIKMCISLCNSESEDRCCLHGFLFHDFPFMDYFCMPIQ